MNHVSRDQQPTDPSWRPPQYRPDYVAPGRRPQTPGLATVKSFVPKDLVTAGLLFVGLALAAISLFLPWTTITAKVLFGTTTIDASPFRGGWSFLILLVIAGAGWLAWPTISGAQMLFRRIVGLTGVVGLLGVFFLIGAINYAQGISEKQQAIAEAGDSADFIANGVDVSLGFGFVLYTMALVAIAVGLGRVWARRSTAGKRAP
ncbi:hypothetical protein BST27_29410 [Mycobacterium intermedium]|uniref:Uncharacterized protein n=1 Tax=Mycobacterium intermedium TaxID=28445 RepID=A0A1E3SCB3_MYCIE|nr:hypothetical protein [Mycobacterium intermedium]MCV6962502.1 hypothetical protein [Mycobacterium intermedium]ODQ99773.1 hypothetical protein BHQ20_15870 [Mycobacterium intermedium]OPE48508.1 hypothetical protein BV508_17685 [Mycobacterium intermedium]ORA91616.1 hypothetical protein BST27_29410 [Mycobacterium intermedium]